MPIANGKRRVERYEGIRSDSNQAEALFDGRQNIYVRIAREIFPPKGKPERLGRVR